MNKKRHLLALAIVLLCTKHCLAAPTPLEDACAALNIGQRVKTESIIYAHPELVNEGCWKQPFLIMEARAGNNEFVDFALKNGANLLIRGSGGQTVLHDLLWTKEHRMLPMIKRWPLNADTVNAEDDWGRTPLHYAVPKFNFEVQHLTVKASAMMRRDAENLQAPDGRRTRPVVVVQSSWEIIA
ncbi:MAG: ankyrin repeat domain-containing protein [Elusimicrobiota bacterium]|nr:MAG: ankyrin repeat domain-containing protein [Elusimicrobiota bacterium]